MCTICDVDVMWWYEMMYDIDVVWWAWDDLMFWLWWHTIDGVWEFISNEQAISVVWKYRHDLQEAANQLVEEAQKQWRKEEEVIDDITCVIVQFNTPK